MRIRYWISSVCSQVFGLILMVSIIGVPLTFACVMGYNSAVYLNPPISVWDIIRFLWGIVIASLLGFFLCLFPGCIFGWIVNSILESLNGGPFKKGDTVRILTGPHRGRITEVYSIWQGNTLRVRLGPVEEEKFKDIFWPSSLFMVKSRGGKDVKAESRGA